MPGRPEEAWGRLWDVDRHTRAVPLTRVSTHDHQPLGWGQVFTARTRLGPFAIDDVMVVRSWEPPVAAVVEKVGSWLGGRIEVTLEPSPPGTILTWEQDFTARGLPRAVARLVCPLVERGYARSLRAILADPGQPPPPSFSSRANPKKVRAAASCIARWN